MGKKSGNSWFNAVKKAFRSPTNDDEKKKKISRRIEQTEPQEEDQKKRGKKRWIFSKHLSLETTIQHNVAKCANSSAVRICSGEENLARKQPKIETEQRRAFAVAMATTAAVATAQAAVEIIRRGKPAILVNQDKAAIVIQKHFRGYLARRALMALRGVVKLQAIIRGHNVRKRAKMTLKCIESLVRVQSLVCDQRRRLSCEAAPTSASIFTPHNKTSSRVPSSLDVNSSELEEIRTLIQKAKECSLKQGKTLAHALSQQIWGKQDDEFSDKSSTAYSCNRKDRNLCNPIKTSVEVYETSFSLYNRHEPYLDSMMMETPFKGKHLTLSVQSPKSPSYPKTRSIPCSPCYHHEGRRKSEAAETPTWRGRMSMSENSCPLPRPNYMAATASTMARVRPNSTPRQRRTSPSREAIGSARKRLSFPVHDGHHFEDKSNFQRCRGSDEMPYYGTD